MGTAPETDIASELRWLKLLLLEEAHLILKKDRRADWKWDEPESKQEDARLAALRKSITTHFENIEGANYGVVYYFTYAGPHGERKNVYPTFREATQARQACGQSRALSAMGVSRVHDQRVRDFDKSGPSRRINPNFFEPEDFILARDAAHRAKMDAEFEEACRMVAQRLRGAPFFLHIELRDPLSFGWSGVFATRAECNATIQIIKDSTKHGLLAQDMLIFESNPYNNEDCMLVWNESRGRITQAIISKILEELAGLSHMHRRALAPEANADRDRS